MALTATIQRLTYTAATPGLMLPARRGHGHAKKLCISMPIQTPTSSRRVSHERQGMAQGAQPNAGASRYFAGDMSTTLSTGRSWT